MEQELIYDVAVCIIAAWVMGVACQAAKQPLLLAYLAAGFAIGPHGFKWVTNAEAIDAIASIGLVLLLFLIGLEMDLKKMLSAGRAISLTALLQICGCLGLGLLFFWGTGFASGWMESFYLAVAAAMSSTVIIIKVLHDKRELETLAGRITVGILVLQDLAVILFLALQPNLRNPALGHVTLALGKVLLLVSVAYVASRFLLPPIFKFVARLPELVMVGALAWCFALAGFADALGLSREMGALVAGVMVSTFPYTLDVVAKVTSIRDFFVTLFFVGLGMSVPFPTVDLLLWMVLFSMFVVGSRLVTVFPPLHFMRLGHRVSLLPAVNLCQLSELSLVVLSLGKASGEVSTRSMNVAAFAFGFLAVDSTYAILKNDDILRKTSPWLKKLGFRDMVSGGAAAPAPEKHSKRIYLLGFSWAASSILEEITRQRPALLNDICVVDFNPQVHRRLAQKEIHAIYGDISQRDVLWHAGVGEAEVLICSLPDTVLKGATNLKLLRQLRDLNPKAQIVVHAEKLADVQGLYAAGANYVSTPRLLEASAMLEVLEAVEKDLLPELRRKQAEDLADRDEVLP
jgi:Kef-type K+ transport system membrane component KefB